MTVRNLGALFEPKSIALIGASNQPRSVGAVTAKNLFEGGFPGPIMTVNPHERAIRSTINYHSVEELPLAPDLAVIASCAFLARTVSGSFHQQKASTRASPTSCREPAGLHSSANQARL